MKSHADHSTYSQRRLKPEGKSMHGRIVSELGLSIVAGELRPGERLPPESVLLGRYEVSRPVLREAVRVLVAKGLVVSRQRAGALVRPRNEWHLLDPDVLYWLIQAQPQRNFLGSLMELRRIFEPAAAALAAKAASEAQLDGIAEAYAGMEAARSIEQLLEPDLAFHRRIAEATGNELLAYLGNMLSLALRESIILSSQLPNTHEHALPRHKAILSALRKRDPEAARQASLVQLEETGDELSAPLKSSQAVDLA